MKKEKVLQLRMTAKTMMIALLLGVAGKTYAYDFSAVCETGQTLYYNITNAEYHYVELTYPASDWSGYTKPTGNIILPKYVYDANDDLYFVTTIGQSAFDNCSGLTSVIIGNFVTTIGSYAFRNCYGLTSITIPNSVITISSYAFNHCHGLTSLTIPNSVTTIDYDAFSYCRGLTSIIIPNSVTMVSGGTFSND